jgi:hypothetical protein
VGKAIQCPSCGHKHGVSGLPDAPSFKCEGCGKPLKIPTQFRPSVMASSRHVRAPDSPRPEPTAVRPPRPTRASAPSPAAARPAKVPRRAAGTVPKNEKVALPLRVLAWVVALALGLVVTLWVARVTGWLSGQRLVDVFIQTGFARYIRVIAIAPVWALFTTLFLTLFLEGGRALARRRAEKRAAERSSQRRAEPDPVDASDGDATSAYSGAADRERVRRAAAPRGGP